MWVHVKWYTLRTSIQVMTQCHTATGPADSRVMPTLLPLASLVRCVHFVQHGMQLLLNKYFIK